MRPDLTTAAQTMAFLKHDEELANKNKAQDTPAVAPVSGSSSEESIDANSFNRQPYNNRGSYNPGGYRGRGQSRGAARGSYNGQRGGNSGNSGNSGNTGNGNSGNKSQGSGNNQKKVRPVCIHCRINGHTQEVCRSRIAQNAPCYNSKGLPFYPPQVSANSDQAKNGENDDAVASVESVFHHRA